MLHEVTLDGARIGYSDTTRFYVQVGKGSKGAYKTRYSVTGDLGIAVRYYASINIGKGYKKRLYSPDMNKPVLVKEAS